MLSKYTHIYLLNNRIVLFNSLNKDIFITGKVDDDLSIFPSGLLDKSIGDHFFRRILINHTTELKEHGMLSVCDYEHEKKIQSISEEIKKKRKINVIYFILTENCNLRCKYCYRGSFQYNNTVNKSHNLIACLKHLFERGQLGDELKIILYGGEPTLCMSLMHEVFIDLELFFRNKRFNYRYDLISNGTLLNHLDLNIFRKNNINLIISLDGLDNKTNGQRIFPDGKSSLIILKKNLKILIENNIKFNISTTINTNNINSLENQTIKFISNYSPIGITYNLPRNTNEANKLDIKFYTKKLFECYQICNEHGVFEDRISRILNSVFNKSIWLKDCAAYGNQIVIWPDGELSVCHANKNDYRIGNSNKFELNQNFENFNNRHPFSMKDCVNCPCIASCGGGCAIESFNRLGEINRPDSKFCEFAKYSLFLLLNKIAHEYHENYENGFS